MSLTTDEIRTFCTDISNTSKVVLILDGFDECDMSEDDINDMFKEIGDIRTLITTRSTHVEALQTYTLMTIDGFDEKGVHTYVHKYFEGDQEATNLCLSKIKSNNVVNDFAYVPLLLSMICYLSQSSFKSKERVETMSSLFNTFLRALFRNFCQKSDTTEDETEANVDFPWENCTYGTFTAKKENPLVCR